MSAGGPRVALLCLADPEAGASTSGGADPETGSRGWAAALGPQVEVRPIAPPVERGSVVDAAGLDALAVAGALAEALAAGADRPYAIYGQGVGARVGFEAIRELHRGDGRLPLRLYVAGGGPPLPPLPGDPAEIPPPVPVVAFAATADPAVTPFDMLGWGACTSAGFRLRTEPGNRQQLERLGAAIRDDLLVAAARAGAERGGDEGVDGPWEPGAQPLAAPAPDEVHLWCCLLDGAPELAVATGELSPPERARAARFRRPVDADRFVGRTVLLRRLLGRYGARVGAAGLAAGRTGKPRGGGAQLRFSASHSAGMALIAVTSGAEVGVDVERLVPLADLDGFCAGAMHPDELAEHAALEQERRLEHALAIWTAKEAVRKAAGDGHRFEPGRLSFAGQDPAGPWRLNPGPELEGLRRWRVRHLDLAGAVGAVAVELNAWRPRLERLGG